MAKIFDNNNKIKWYREADKSKAFWNSKIVYDKNTKEPRLQHAAIPCYWMLDNKVYNSETEQYEIYKKKVAVPSEENPDRYEYKPFTYDDLGDDAYWGNLLVWTDKGMLSVKKCIDACFKYKANIIKLYERRAKLLLENPEDSPIIKALDKKQLEYKRRSAALKIKIDDVLDRVSRNRIREASKDLWTAERRLAEADKLYKKAEGAKHGKDKTDAEILAQKRNDKYVACYPYIPEGFVSSRNPEGLDQPVDCAYMKFTGCYFDYLIGDYVRYEFLNEGFVLNTNATVQFDKLIADSKAVYKVIKKAVQYNLTPNTEEGFYYIEGWDKTDLATTTVYKPLGLRGMCITADAYEELRAAVNWYEARAELDEDMSDKITLVHPNGVDTVTVTTHEYESNREKYDDWKEFFDTIDYQAPLHSDGQELDEYDADIAALLDDEK